MKTLQVTRQNDRPEQETWIFDWRENHVFVSRPDGSPVLPSYTARP
jgi:hypothetical protein